MKNKVIFNKKTVILLFKDNKILIDKNDYEKISKHSWCISKTGYAVSNIDHKVTKMHRYILGLSNPKIIVDHINHNKLDNRRKNLRLCSDFENSRNTTVSKNNKLGHLGISLTKTGKYRARLMLNRKEIWLGSYHKIEDAIKAREEGEKKYFGKYAPCLSKKASKNNS